MNNNEVDSFLDGLNNEANGDVFTPETEDVFKDKKESSEVEEEAAGQGKQESVPFHKDPKVQKFIEKEIEKRLKDVPPREEKASKEDIDDAEDVLTRIIGNDTPEKVKAVKDFKNLLYSLEERGAKKALQQIEAQEREESEADLAAETELSDGFEYIESTYNVDLSSETPSSRKLRNDFIDFIEEIAPKDANGEVIEFPDFGNAFKLFNSTRRPQTNRAKELAARSMTRSSDASTAKPTGDNSWKAVDKLFGKLGN